MNDKMKELYETYLGLGYSEKAAKIEALIEYTLVWNDESSIVMSK
tara:strand:- start:166 stop:300 length:135 start_codon:yes stop_codon:yes gene_type:complete